MADHSLTDLDRLEARGRWLRRGALVLILGAAAAAGLLIWQLWLGGDDDEIGEVETVVVGRATIRETIAASGTAEAADETELRFATIGRVKEILVALGQEVKAGDSLAALETDDVENRLATAEANLAVAQIRLQQIEKGASSADLTSADQAVVSAQVTLDKAVDDLNDLLEGPSGSEVAAAEQAVFGAESTLASAEANLDKVIGGPTELELASARQAVVTAEGNLANAELLLQSAEVNLSSAESVLESAGDTYCTYEEALDEICDDFSVPLTSSQLQALWEQLASDEDGISEELEAIIIALLESNTSYETADSVASTADDNVEDAEEALELAEENLEDMEEAPDAEDVAAAEAAVESAESALKTAQLQLQDLLDGPSQFAIDAAYGAVRRAWADLSAAIARRDDLLAGAEQEDVDMQVQQVRLAEIAVDEARKALDEATLKAPYDGTVASIDVEVGDLVSSGSQLSAITLLTPGALKVRLTVGETDLPGLHPGMVGVMIFDALQERLFPMIVTAIGLAPQVEQGIVIYVVEGALVGVGEAVADRPVPGMNGSAVLVTEERPDVLVVPNRAIRRRGDEIVVEAMVGGKSEIRAIETGLSDADNTEVLSGLEEGDLVVVPGSGGVEEQEEQESLPEGIR